MGPTWASSVWATATSGALMNPPNAAPDSVEQWRYHIDKLKGSFTTTWNDTKNILDFLSQTAHGQTERIQSLELHAAELEKINHEKTAQIEAMEARFMQVNQAFHDLIAQKDSQLLAVRSHNDKLQAALRHSHGVITDSRTRREAAEAKYRNATAELETFRATLGEGQEHGQSYEQGLSEQQLASIEAALKNELDKRSQVGMPSLSMPFALHVVLISDSVEGSHSGSKSGRRDA